MNFTFHPEALQEYIDAIHYYRKISPALANAFAAEVENSINQILLYPEAWQPIEVGVRRCLVRRLPFGIYYTVESSNSTTIQAVMHLSRKPGYWKEREKNRNRPTIVRRGREYLYRCSRAGSRCYHAGACEQEVTRKHCCPQQGFQ